LDVKVALTDDAGGVRVAGLHLCFGFVHTPSSGGWIAS
jgi:hypothetical protein